MSADGDTVRAFIEEFSEPTVLRPDALAALARLEAAEATMWHLQEAWDQERASLIVQRDTLAKLIADWLPDMDDDMQQAFRAACRGGAGMSADGDIVRKALDHVFGVSAPLARREAALAALARLEAERETFRQEALAANKEQWKAKAQRDTLAEALRQIAETQTTSVFWRANVARAALAEAGLE